MDRRTTLAQAAVAALALALTGAKLWFTSSPTSVARAIEQCVGR